MSFIIGVLLALGVGAFATSSGLDRDKAFHPTVMIVIAAYYVLFALMGGASEALLAECLVGAAFLVAAVTGFKRTMWLVVCALAAHGVLDFFHARLITNPGVPVWWPDFCLAYDLAAACYLAALLLGRDRARAARSASPSAWYPPRRHGNEGARAHPGVGRSEPVDLQRAAR